MDQALATYVEFAFVGANIDDAEWPLTVPLADHLSASMAFASTELSPSCFYGVAAGDQSDAVARDFHPLKISQEKPPFGAAHWPGYNHSFVYSYGCYACFDGLPARPQIRAQPWPWSGKIVTVNETKIQFIRCELSQGRLANPDWAIE